MSRGARKVAVIGAGNVGATCAFVLAQKNVGEIVMLDIYEGFAKGKALDMSQGGQILNYDGKITGTKDYSDIAGADVVVVTSGFPRQPGMSREDLIGKNADIISQVGAGIRDHAPDSIIVMVTNPLDLMTYHMQRVTGFPHHRVVGQAFCRNSLREVHIRCLEVHIWDFMVWCVFRFTTFSHKTQVLNSKLCFFQAKSCFAGKNYFSAFIITKKN